MFGGGGRNKVRDIKREIYNYKGSPIKNVACDISQVAHEDSDLNTKLRIPGVINRKISIWKMNFFPSLPSSITIQYVLVKTTTNKQTKPKETPLDSPAAQAYDQETY